MVARRDLLGLLGAGAVLHLAAGAASGSLLAPTDGGLLADGAHAGVARYRFEPQRATDVVRLWEDGLLAAARRWPGFVRGILLMNAEAGEGIGMGIFASKAAADAFGATEAFRAADARLATALLAPPVREEFQVYFN